MTPFAEGMLDARFGRSAWADSTVDNVTHNDTYSRMLLHWKPRTGTGADGGRRIRLLEALGVRLRRLPNVAAPLPSHLCLAYRARATRERLSRSTCTPTSQTLATSRAAPPILAASFAV